MHIFYSGYSGAYHASDVPSDSPIEAGEDVAKSVFAGICDEDSFLGIILGGGRTMQLYRQADATLHAEVLNEEALSIRYCTVNTPLAELLIEAAFRGEDFEQKIAFSGVTWNDDTLKNA